MDMDQTLKASTFENLDANLVNPKLQEANFIKHYLPFYTHPNPPDEAMATFIAYHLNVAENPYNYVDVYNGKEYLFTIPPLYRDDLDERINSFGKDNLGKILADISLCQTSGNHFEANRISLTALPHVVDDKTTISQKHIQMWKDIFKRYNITPVMYNKDGEIKTKKLEDGAKPWGGEVQILDDL